MMTGVVTTSALLLIFNPAVFPAIALHFPGYVLCINSIFLDQSYNLEQQALSSFLKLFSFLCVTPEKTNRLDLIHECLRFL